MKPSALSPHEVLLLQAALHPDAAVAASSWQQWTEATALETAPLEDLRLLPAIYAHLSRVAPGLDLPAKLRGKAKATFTRNTLLSHGSLAMIDELAARVPVMLTKGLAICLRFDAWAARSMADVDVHVPVSQLPMACEALVAAGWTPDHGMTVRSLLHRTVLRRDSWNFSRGSVSLDLHWRLRDVPEADWLDRQMWATGESVEVSGRTVVLQSPEFAFVSSLSHGFLKGSKTDALQTIVDTAWLLPRCKAQGLGTLVDKVLLQDAFGELMAVFDRIGLKSTVSADDAGTGFPALGGAVAAADSRAAANGTSRSFSRPVPVRHRTEHALLRRPGLYRLWNALGRKARVERWLVRLAGPFSRPLSERQPYADDHDLRACSGLDAVAGPGWGWPEADRSAVWSDRPDARLLLPLRRVADHLIVLGFSDGRHDSPNGRIDVFANGSYLTTIDFKDGVADSDRCLVVSRHVLFGPWVELSLRPRPYRGSDAHWPEDYGISRAAPIRRLRIVDLAGMSEAFRPANVPLLYLKILKGEEPYVTKWRRIRQTIETSPERDSPGLPPGFDPIQYTLFYSDLFEEEVDPYAHYLTYGQREGRGWR